MPPHIKSTKRLDKNTQAVRDTILVATEPDTLLFELLPKSLGYAPKMSPADIKKFSKTLAKSINVLQSGFAKIFEDIRQLLFAATGIDSRTKLSDTAKKMEPSITDQRMKVFLGAVSADTLEKTEDWINYVAMSLTDVPPIDWKDEQRDMFENNLQAMSARFKRLAGIHFAKISDNFIKPSYQVTITHANGTEQHNVVSLKPKQKEKIKKIASMIKREMQKNGLAENDINALIALLSSESK